MKESTKKATFNLSPRVLAGLDEAVAAKAAPSKNALVERALVRELNDIRRQARRARWEEGSRDELLLRDIAALEAAFRTADAETSGSAD
jgi:hypothetical protein